MVPDRDLRMRLIPFAEWPCFSGLFKRSMLLLSAALPQKLNAQCWETKWTDLWKSPKPSEGVLVWWAALKQEGYGPLKMKSFFFFFLQLSQNTSNLNCVQLHRLQTSVHQTECSSCSGFIIEKTHTYTRMRTLRAEEQSTGVNQILLVVM